MDERQEKDQRSEKATPEQIRKAREEGRVGFSGEFVGAIVLACAVVLAWNLGDAFAASLCNTLRFSLTDFQPVIKDPQFLVGWMIARTLEIGVPCCFLLIPTFLLTAIGGLLQTRFNISLRPLRLDWNRLNPKSGFSRIFSSSSLVRGGLSICKASLILVLVYLLSRGDLGNIAMSGFAVFPRLMAMTAGIILRVAIAIAMMQLVVGLTDLIYQKWKHMEDLKMSPREIREENKSTEGDPLVKARVRKLQLEMSKKRMLSEVQTASVVITNPTHLAVTLRYEASEMHAPKVIAKGSDHLAKKIIEVARREGIPVVERKPVARFLYANVEIGSMIPTELYQAVAEILNFVHA